MFKHFEVRRNLGWILFLVLSATISLKAQETEKPESRMISKEDPKLESENRQDPEKTNAQKNENRVFVPSEEVSEDYAVPFPADI